jgi:methylthioribose-1-phosphate isomerase
VRKSGDKFRTIWLKPDDSEIVQIIDQRRLPHEYVVVDLVEWRDGATAISDMLVRGAPLIGATAAWSLYLAALEYRDRGDCVTSVLAAADALAETRPTAVNLRWALERMRAVIANTNGDLAESLAAEAAARKPGKPVNILTHCNAGSLATINYGTATAPVYFAHAQGIPVHVWVDETRPRNQGSQLTAWELAENGVPHTLIVDNAGGHLMQHGLVDICITGTDRTTRTGDVANKIGTYLKALAARDNGVPFYVALPSTTIDWTIADGLRDIPIEERDPDEVRKVYGRSGHGLCFVDTLASDTAVSNYAFDVTPARLVTGLITERGICDASEEGLAGLFPDARTTTA